MREFISFTASLLFHAGVLGCMYWSADVLPTLWTQQEGRASVQLIASLASKAQPEEPSEENEIEIVEREPLDVPNELEPAADLERQAKRDVPLHDLHASRVAQVDPLLPPEMRPHEPKEQIELELPKPVPRRQREEVKEVAQIDATASPYSMAIEGADVDEEPTTAPSNPTPPYPSDALAAGVQGRVVLRVVVEADGTASRVQLHQSSGLASLDRSALDTVTRWRFVPAKRRGIPVAYEVLVPVRFSIRH